MNWGKQSAGAGAHKMGHDGGANARRRGLGQSLWKGDTPSERSGLSRKVRDVCTEVLRVLQEPIGRANKTQELLVHTGR